MIKYETSEVMSNNIYRTCKLILSTAVVNYRASSPSNVSVTHCRCQGRKDIVVSSPV